MLNIIIETPLQRTQTHQLTWASSNFINITHKPQTLKTWSWLQRTQSNHPSSSAPAHLHLPAHLCTCLHLLICTPSAPQNLSTYTAPPLHFCTLCTSTWISAPISAAPQSLCMLSSAGVVDFGVCPCSAITGVHHCCSRWCNQFQTKAED